MKANATCQNCGKTWPVDALKAIEDIHQRVEPGEPMPSGECPECGALCQPVVGRCVTCGTECGDAGICTLCRAREGTLAGVLAHTDWLLLRNQKAWLIGQSESAHGTGDKDSERAADGLLGFIGAIQDAAAVAGYPVVWLEAQE